MRAFFQDEVKKGGVEKDAEDFILRKSEFHSPITIPCAFYTGNKVNLRERQMEEPDVVRDAYFIAALWRLLGTEIINRRSSEERQLALMNAVCFGAGQPVERVLDVRQVAEIDK